jgi:hypothetical protein
MNAFAGWGRLSAVLAGAFALCGPVLATQAAEEGLGLVLVARPAPEGDAEVEAVLQEETALVLQGSGWVLLTKENLPAIAADRGVDPMEAYEKASSPLDLARRLTARYLVATEVKGTGKGRSAALRLYDVATGELLTTTKARAVSAPALPELRQSLRGLLAVVPYVRPPAPAADGGKRGEPQALRVCTRWSGPAPLRQPFFESVAAAIAPGGLLTASPPCAATLAVSLESDRSPVAGTALTTSSVVVRALWTPKRGEVRRWEVRRREATVRPAEGLSSAVEASANELGGSVLLELSAREGER